MTRMRETNKVSKERIEEIRQELIWYRDVFGMPSGRVLGWLKEHNTIGARIPTRQSLNSFMNYTYSRLNDGTLILLDKFIKEIRKQMQDHLNE